MNVVVSALKKAASMLKRNFCLYVLLTVVLLAILAISPLVRGIVVSLVKLIDEIINPPEYLTIGSFNHSLPLQYKLEFFAVCTFVTVFVAYFYKIILNILHGDKAKFNISLKTVIRVFIYFVIFYAIWAVIYQPVHSLGVRYLALAIFLLIKIFLFFTTVIIVDTDLNPLQAVGRSLSIAYKYFIPVLLLELIALLLFIIGTVTVIGLLVAIPFNLLTVVATYFIINKN